MSGCCDPRGCNDIFGPRFARHLTSRYRKRGLDKTAARMAEFIVDHGITDATILEIGGGIGDIQLELLGRGARHATNLELVDAYDTAANDLARAAGMSDRVTRRQVDIAATPGAVPPADIVILHRVVCCYPDYERLLTSAAGHARRLLVFSHPPRNLVSRALMAAQNLTFRLLGKSFRTYTHPPAAMVAVAERSGMRTRYTYHGPVWQVVGLSRATHGRRSESLNMRVVQSTPPGSAAKPARGRAGPRPRDPARGRTPSPCRVRDSGSDMVEASYLSRREDPSMLVLSVGLAPGRISV
jgi:hypothetical protein